MTYHVELVIQYDADNAADFIRALNAVSTIAILLRYDYDPTTVRPYDVSRAPVSNLTQADNGHATFSS